MKIKNYRTEKELELLEQVGVKECHYFGIPFNTTLKELEDFFSSEGLRQIVIRQLNYNFFRPISRRTKGDNEKFITEIEAKICGSKQNLSRKRLIKQIIEAIDNKDFNEAILIRKSLEVKENIMKEIKKKRALLKGDK